MSDRLTEIRERFDAIIPGPWRWYGNTATDQVMLATTNRGRLFILVPDVRTTQHVFDHNNVESYDLESARARITEWCPAHRSDADDMTMGECQCDELRQFLAGELLPEDGFRDYDGPVLLTRGITVRSDLRFPDKSLGDRRGEHGGHMRSYRDSPRYEVLGRLTEGFFRGYRTRTEYEAQTGKAAEDALYREDFCGLDQPEATFIERAPEDIDYLLKRLEAAEELVAELQELAMCENRGQQFQATVDARARTVKALDKWEVTK